MSTTNDENDNSKEPTTQDLTVNIDEQNITEINPSDDNENIQDSELTTNNEILENTDEIKEDNQWIQTLLNQQSQQNELILAELKALNQNLHSPLTMQPNNQNDAVDRAEQPTKPKPLTPRQKRQQKRLKSRS